MRRLLTGINPYPGRLYRDSESTAEVDSLAQMVDLLGPFLEALSACGTRTGSVFSDETGNSKVIPEVHPVLLGRLSMS